MWIKRSLVVVPILLFAFLAQSVFWVPGTASVAGNDSRQNRIILYMGGNPEDMNPWTSTKTTDSTISDYFFEGLVRYNNMYELEPWLASQIVVGHEITTLVPASMTIEDFEAAIRAEFGDVQVQFEPVDTPVLRSADDATLKKIGEYGLEAFVASMRETLASMKCAKISLSAAPVASEIVSAVKADFAADLEKRTGRPLFPEFDYSALAAQLLPEIPEAVRDRSKLDVESLAEAMASVMTSLGLAAPVRHNPVLQLDLHKGIHWTDGPFFSSPEKTWLVHVNGDEAGNLVADTSDDAVRLIRDRLQLAPQDSVQASNYAQRFGNETKGPWWGKGPEFTSRDVKITYEHLKNADYGSPRRSSYTSIVEIRTSAQNRHQVSVVYDELYSPALGDLTGSILPFHVWNLTAWKHEAVRRGAGPDALRIEPERYNPMRALRSRDREFALRPSYIGAMLLDPMNGDALPYWQNNLRVRLRRNEFYWNRLPEYDYVDWFVFDPALGSETSEVVFLGGGMDIYGAKDYQVKRYEAMSDRYYVIKRQPTTYEYLGFNTSRDQLKDRRVRLALSMAINVDEILEYVVFGQGERISGPAYPVMPWYNREYRMEHTWRTGPNKGQSERLEFIPFNMEEAKALLIEAGMREQGGKLFHEGKPFRLQLVNDSKPGARHNTAVLAKERWEQLGVEVEYRQYEWNDFIQRFIMAMNFDVCVLGWSGGLDFDKRQLWHSESLPPNGLNFAGLKSDKADALMEKILKTYDADEQVRMSHEIFAAIADEIPYVFLYSPYTTTIVDRHLVWRKQVGVDKQGKPIYEDRPLDHEHIANSRAIWRFFEPELVRRESIPQFTAEDRRR